MTGTPRAGAFGTDVLRHAVDSATVHTVLRPTARGGGVADRSCHHPSEPLLTRQGSLRRPANDVLLPDVCRPGDR